MNDLSRGALADLPASIIADSLESYWYGSLSLRLGRVGEATRLLRRQHRGPLYVHRPFYPEGPDLAHVYILHPPGGLVSGDSLHTDIMLQNGAQALFTTPGAGRLYHARRGAALQQQSQRITLERDAGCEWFPQENIVFNGANARLDTRVDLSEGSTFQGWEIAVLGLPANGVEFTSGSLRQRFSLYRKGRPLLVENLTLDDDSQLREASVGLRSLPVSGIFVAGPFEKGKDLASELGQLRETVLPERTRPAHWAVTRQGDFIVMRYLGGCAEQARALFIAGWRRIRPVLVGRQACEPRIWST